MKGSFKLGELFGIPVRINYTWFVIFALVTVSFATVTYPSMYARWSPSWYWIAGLVTAVLLFVSVLIHELAHSLVSQAYGNPVESITLFIFGGVSSIKEEAGRPRDEFLMSAAGPFSSLLLAGVFFVISLVSVSGSLAQGLFSILAVINLSLAIFNMIPGFPLDGGRVLRAVVWGISGNVKLATRIASISGRLVAALMIIGGLLVAVMGNWATGLWLAFIGWFLENAASQSYQQFLLREMLTGVTARDLMATDCATLAGDPDLQTLVEEHVLREGRRCLLVTRGERLAGLVTLHSVKSVPKDEWATTRASSIMIPFDSVRTANVNESALEVLRRMDEGDINQIPVMENGRLVGMITRERLLHFIRIKAELDI